MGPIHLELRMVMATDYVAPMEMAVTSLRSMIKKLYLEGILTAKKQKHSKLVHLLLPHHLLAHLPRTCSYCSCISSNTLSHPHCSYTLPYTHHTYNVPNGSCRSCTHSLSYRYPTNLLPY